MNTHLAPSRLGDVLVLRPGRALSGVVRVDGSKNACLPLIAAAAVLRRSVRLTNVPSSTDVQTMLGLLDAAAFDVSYQRADRTAAVLPGSDGGSAVDLTKAARIRASYYLVPALLAAYGNASLPWPGGCRIGDRGMEQHFAVYRAFGDEVSTTTAGYTVRATRESPAGVRVCLPFRSRGASIAALLRAAATGARLEVANPNLSPETTGVLAALRTAGWEAEVGEARITLTPPGTHSPEPLEWLVPGDKIEAGTLACAIAATGGAGRIAGVTGADMAPLADLLTGAGVPVSLAHDATTLGAIHQHNGAGLHAVASLAPGGLDADFEPVLLALAFALPGRHTFADAINPGRHANLLPQLRRLGAVMDEITTTRCALTGPQTLTGAEVETTDIRTGAALLIAGLTAAGTTTVSGLSQLARGYADLPAKLAALGADIEVEAVSA